MFPIEFERVFLQDEVKHFSDVVSWYGRTVFVECFVCNAYVAIIPSSCGILVYKLVTSIETRTAIFSTFVFSTKLMKSVVSLRYTIFVLWL